MRKKIITVLLIGFVAFQISYANESKAKPKKIKSERDLVENLLDGMIGNEDLDGKCFLKYISPVYIQENKIDTSLANVNYYGLADYIFIKKTQNILVYRIYGKNNSWEHELIFRVDKIGRKYYVLPGKYEDNVIQPWREARTFL